MKIKKGTVRTLSSILGGIKLNKLTDKEVKLGLIKDHLALRKLANEILDDQNAIIMKFQEDWGDEFREVSALRKDGSDITGHEDYFKAEEEANTLLAELQAAEVDVDIITVDMEQFISALTDDDITLEHVAFLADNGIIG